MGGLLSGGLLLGTLWGIRVRVHWTFLIVLVMIAPMGSVALLLFATLFVTVLIHEFGHCFAARYLGGEARDILLWPLGGLAYILGADNTPLKSISVALAGPMTHVPIGAVCLTVLTLSGCKLEPDDFNPMAALRVPEMSMGLMYVYAVLKMQILLFCFNVFLPAYPMDGGRIVVALLATRLPLPQTMGVASFLTLASALWLYHYGEVMIPLFLAFEGLSLLTASLSGGADWHPIARVYQRPRLVELAPTTFIAPDVELRPCPQCGKMLHPRSEICVYCDARF